MSDKDLPIRERVKWHGREKELDIAQRYFKGFRTWKIVAILGIAISALATFINTYDAITNINSQIQVCTQSESLKRELNKQFIVLIVFSCLAIIFGIIIAWLLRHSTNPMRIITMGIIFGGVFGILYAISIRLQSSTMSSVLKAGISWSFFIGFIIWGFIMGRNTGEEL